MHYPKTRKRVFWCAMVLWMLGYLCAPAVHAQKNNYKSRWKKVSDFQNKNLPKSALKEVEDIYKQAQKDNNAAQLVKAIVYKLKYVVIVEENDLVKSLSDLQAEVKNAKFPVKPVLHSMLGQIYWQYYRQNRYRYRNRTATAKDFKQADLNTWDLRKITEETMRQYKLSLADPEKLKKVKVALYDDIIVKGGKEQRKLRPTLYDFLAHRAIGFFRSSEPNLTKPAYQFTLNKPEYLQDADAFANMKVDSKDTTSYKFYALTILQDLVKFHLKDADASSLVDADLTRLGFVYDHLTTNVKKDLYRKALERLEKKSIKFPISTEVTYAIASIYYQLGETYNPLKSDKNKWQCKKAMEMCDAAIARFPKSRGAQQCRNLKIMIQRKGLQLRVDEVSVPNRPFIVSVGYKNTPQLHWRIYKVTRDWLKKSYEGCKNAKYRQDCFLEAAYRLTPVHSWKTDLPNDKDYQYHWLETKLPALDYGHYMIVASASANFKIKGNAVASEIITMSNISYLNRSIRAKGLTQVYVLDRSTGKPMSNVKAKVWVRYYDSKSRKYLVENGGEYTSNREGYFEVPYSEDYYKRRFWVEFQKGKDWVSSLPIENYKYSSRSGNFYRYKNNSNPKTRTQTFFFLDRKIYRPGQTVYFKGLVLDTDGTKHDIKPNYKTTVTLYDVNRQKSGTVNVTTNEFGTFNGTFIAPNKGLNGMMRLREAHGQVNFSVEDYKRPKFEVNFKPVKGNFKVNEMVSVTGKAKAYSGANIDGAKVTYRVVRRASFPRWYSYYYGYTPASPDMQITKGTTTTNAQGEFTVKFNAIPDVSVGKETQPTFSYYVYADVTDMNGETHSNNTRASVGYRSLEIDIAVNAEVNRQQKANWGLRTVNLNGQFQAAKGTITIHRLNAPKRVFRSRRWRQPDKFIHTAAEWEKWFPHDYYKDENNRYKWAKGRQVLQTEFATVEKDKKSLALNIANIGQWKQGYYVLEMKSKDKDGNEVKAVKYFAVYDPGAKTTPGNQVFFFKTQKGTVEPGEKAQIVLGTAARDVQVLYEIEHDGKIVEKRWMKLNRNQRMVEILAEEAYRGNFGVHFTFVKDNRWYHQDKTIQVPRTNKALDISFETFRNKLKPGEKEEWRIKIKGKKGDKVAAEMVATLYDASLDTFRANYFNFSIYGTYYANMRWRNNGAFGASRFNVLRRKWNKTTKYVQPRSYDYLNWFGYMYGRRYSVRELESKLAGRTAGVVTNQSLPVSAPRKNAYKPALFAKKAKSEEELDDVATETTKEAGGKPQGAAKGGEGDLGAVKARTNFNETAFFYPSLRTNENGDIIVKFTVPEALTKWKMLGFAHTKILSMVLPAMSW